MRALAQKLPTASQSNAKPTFNDKVFTSPYKLRSKTINPDAYNKEIFNEQSLSINNMCLESFIKQNKLSKEQSTKLKEQQKRRSLTLMNQEVSVGTMISSKEQFDNLPLDQKDKYLLFLTDKE